MQHLLLLHGAIGASDQLAGLKSILEAKYLVHTPDFRGHGSKNPNNDTFSIPLFAEDVLQYLKENNIRQSAIFGYSMGGYVAMYLAKYHPKTVTKLVTLATKFYWDETVAAKEVKMLDADTIIAKVPVFAAQLAQRHGEEHWKRLLGQTKELLSQLGRNNTLQLSDYASIHTPCLLLLGDKDKMITREETEAVCRQLTDAKMEILPDTAHPIEQVDTVMLANRITSFLYAE